MKASKMFTSVCPITGETEDYPMTGNICYEELPSGAIMFLEIEKAGNVGKIYTAKAIDVKAPSLEVLERDFEFFGIKKDHQTEIKNFFKL